MTPMSIGADVPSKRSARPNMDERGDAGDDYYCGVGVLDGWCFRCGVVTSGVRFNHVTNFQEFNITTVVDKTRTLVLLLLQHPMMINWPTFRLLAGNKNALIPPGFGHRTARR